MNAADESLGNVLLVGLGAVAIQVALDLRRHGAGRLGALNHPGRRSQRIAEALARGACLQLEGQGQHRWLSGNAALDVFHQDPAELRDDWQTLVLCVPADSYLDVVRGLPWERLGGVRTLLLVSAFIGANLLVRSALPAGCQATVLSLSSYYAATKVIDETQPLRALTKAVKRRVYLGSSRPDCPARETWRRVLAGSGVEVVPLATPEAAEGRNVTTYVHSPFFLGEFALARILSEQGPPGFMYKLYPEGPITPGAIGAMRRLWCELSELLRRMGAEPLNLLRFLNDDNYPVHETMLPRAAIDGFAEAGAERQEYLLFGHAAGAQPVGELRERRVPIHRLPRSEPVPSKPVSDRQPSGGGRHLSPMVLDLLKSGVLLAVLASFTFSVMNALVKEASATLPAAEIVFFRSAIGTLLIYLLMRQAGVALSRQGVPMLLVRGVMGALYLVCYFYAIAHIPLADASILAHMSPFFVILFSALFLGERIPRAVYWLLLVVVLGALMIVKPFSYSSYSVYAVVGLLSAVFAAGASVAIRQLSARHHTYEIVFYFLAVATLVAIPLMWNDFVVPATLREWGLLLAIGVVSLLGQVFLTRAFSHESATIVAVTRYIGIVFNAGWGWLFWSEVPDALTIAGGVLIVVACIALSRTKKG